MASDTVRQATSTLLAHIHERLGLDFGFELWDGTRIPADVGAEALRLVINDPGVLGRLLRRRSIETVIEAWSARQVEIAGGDLFDIAERRPQGKGRALLARLDKTLLAKCLGRLFFSRTAAETGGGLAGRDALTSGSSAEAIRHHYDVSNDFYRLFLDERMLYSCAYFTDWSNDLDQAQHDKLDHICRKLRLAEGERFLDIGCGWGALVIHAAENYGVSAHGVTLSEEQFVLANERIAAKGLQERIRIELKPFQDLDGTFDKIASVGMYEHVGFANHADYFRTVRRLLRPRGAYLHHAITRKGRTSERAFHRKPAEYRALVKYIFPGGELDHIGWSTRMLEAHGFEVHDIEGLREHYALTCRHWAKRLAARMDEAAGHAGDARARLWLAYLTGCALTFERGGAFIFQTLATRRDKGPSGLPPTRADFYS
ncbi:MAG TPA: cyclopropane-fatty-acyl-phospholipid synthase family protein [Afifellaceae bacterium]|nr:cyclopropane-fatty-acyl-phospholipid synthase family protein [Afifellaceae bacterium]